MVSAKDAGSIGVLVLERTIGSCQDERACFSGTASGKSR